MLKKFPNNSPAIGLKVLQSKKTQYGNFADNYELRVAVGIVPTCFVIPIAISVKCGKEDIASVEIYRLNAAVYNNRITITHSEKILA